MSFLSLLALLKRFWWAPIILGLAFVVMVQRGALGRKDAKIANYANVMKLNEERIKSAAATFKADQESEARRIETAQNQATQETASEYSSRLRAALALAAQRVRNGQTSTGSASGANKGSSTSQPAITASGNGGMSVVDENDLLICTTNTVKAQGWLAWWKRIQAIPR